MPAKVVETTAAPVGAGVAGEQMQIADRRVPQTQCVDRELGARQGGDPRRTRNGRLDLLRDWVLTICRGEVYRSRGNADRTGFAQDFSLGGDGFEPSVPLAKAWSSDGAVRNRGLTTDPKPKLRDRISIGSR
jgi:hypothetical protein